MLSLNVSTPLKRFILIALLVAGFGLRIFPGKDHFIWSYDQARDSYVIRSIITNHHLVIVGPQTEFVGLSHGPLFYYLLAPFYAQSHGDPNLPGIAMALINFTTVIPIYLLTRTLFKNKTTGWLAVILFLFSYQQLEYARWISNVAVSIPLLTWSYLLLAQVLTKTRTSSFTYLLLGLCLGLTTQAEIFFLSLVAFSTVTLLVAKTKFKSWLFYLFGLSLGLAPFIVAEIKFHFLGARTFITQFLGSHASSEIMTSGAVTSYIDHLGLTTRQTLAGISNPMGFLILIVLVIGTGFYAWGSRQKSDRSALAYVALLFLFHAALFTFHFVNAVFLDMGITIPLILLAAFLLGKLWESNRPASILVGLFIFSSFVFNYQNYLIGSRPFATYGFIQDGILFQQKMELVARMYALTGGQAFSFASIGTPYGVRTVWASVFEQYAQRTGTPLPHWYGYHADGYPGDSLLTPQDFPAPNHIVVRESNVTNLLPEVILSQAIAEQNRTTRVVRTIQAWGYAIELRTPIQATP